MCHADNEKQLKRNSDRNRTPNQERIKTLGEKENYQYLRIAPEISTKE